MLTRENYTEQHIYDIGNALKEEVEQSTVAKFATVQNAVTAQ